MLLCASIDATAGKSYARCSAPPGDRGQARFPRRVNDSRGVAARGCPWSPCDRAYRGKRFYDATLH